MASYQPIKASPLTDTLATVSDSITEVLLKMVEQNAQILNELKLLNARFEAMAETTIKEADVE